MAATGCAESRLYDCASRARSFPWDVCHQLHILKRVFVGCSCSGRPVVSRHAAPDHCIVHIEWHQRIRFDMYIDILILSHLTGQPAHGYEIKKRVERTFRGMIPLNNKLLYPALRRFEERGAVVCEVEHTHVRPDRNVYSLTTLGEDVLRGL